MSTSKSRSGSWRAGITFLLVAAVLLLATELGFQRRVESEAMGLESIAAEAAAQIDGAAHERVRGPQAAAGPEFLAIRHTLREIQGRHKLSSEIYTLRPLQEKDEGQATEFVVMTNASPFVGDRYRRLAEMDPVFVNGQRSRTGLYRSATGAWISGYAPVKAADGRAVALVEVDRPSEDLQAELTYRRLLVLLAAALAAAAVALAPMLVSGRPGARGLLPRLAAQSLSLRIGLAGTVSVLVAVGVVGVLDHREARSELISRLKEHLLSTVGVGAGFVDAGLHAEVASTGEPGSSAFLTLREVLRRIQAGAGLSSPMYTLRRDGDLARFVVMTNETPFVGDPYELRPAMRESLEQGKPGSEGPYTDAHGTWISAWAPILDAQGRAAAVLQADHEMSALITALSNRMLRRVLFALVGMAIAFVLAGILARSIARPVLDLARAAEVVASGDLQARVDIERPDEIGVLARSFNKMSHNLRSMAAALQGYAAAAEQSKELELASHLQAAMVPAPRLRTEKAQVAAQLETAEVGGGTTYDYFPFGQEAYLIFSLAKARAVGLEALSTLLLCKSTLSSLLSNFTFRPQELAGRLNQTLTRARTAASYLVGVYDAAQGWVTVLNAGCPYPYLLRPGPELIQLDETGGPPPGQDAQAVYTDFEVKVEPGDRLILYSPHVVQAPDAEGQPYGLERWESSILRHAALDQDDLCAALGQDLRQHAGPAAAPQDDLAIVVIRFGTGLGEV